ncbi:hypothetical protein NVV94_12130 [Pseudomonas sp. LS1212]|uniref:hypothetical protein n=1 Tax=Pseudomonas sp. LS1212 TaxID=2972478 RepID=UPI00215C1873|nr:hypothetical protein [Pseudomonas sp. LS1212]UVJ46212.1 hypothetical protein NVV94_12130 [Pseudomonas sp. LS1212]
MATRPIRPKPSSRTFATVTLSTAASGVSDSVNVTGLTLSCVQMSTAWDSAGIGFETNVDGSTSFFPVRNSAGDFLVFQAAANRVVAFDPAQFAGLQLLKLTSITTTGAAVAQSSNRVLKLGLSEFI